VIAAVSGLLSRWNADKCLHVRGVFTIAKTAISALCGRRRPKRSALVQCLQNQVHDIEVDNAQEAEAIVQLRAIYLSGDFDRYWQFHIDQDQRRLYPAGWVVVPK
jgi:hypothetical protein